MKELTQKEFAQQIQRLISGEIGRNTHAKALETEKRTINKKPM